MARLALAKRREGRLEDCSTFGIALSLARINPAPPQSRRHQEVVCARQGHPPGEGRRGRADNGDAGIEPSSRRERAVQSSRRLELWRVDGGSS